MEKSLFDVTVRVTPETCHALAKARAGQHNRVVWLCTLLIALGVVSLWAVGSDKAIWLTILLAVLLVQMMLRVRLAAWWLYHSRNEAVDSIRISFQERGIVVRSRVEESLIRYPMVTGLREDRRFLMITMKHHTPLVVAKESLPGGRAGELAEYLKGQTGLEIRPFRK